MPLQTRKRQADLVIELILGVLQGWPFWWFLAALSFLPLFGMPLSPMWVMAGVVYGIKGGLALTLVAMAINFALAYQISQRWLRKPILRLFLRRGIRIPEAQPGEFVKLTIAIRLLPFVPQFMQSYMLGIANVPFLTYYIFSFPPQLAIATGFVVLGGSLFDMKIGGIILGVSLLIAAALLLNIARKRQSSEMKLDQNQS